MVIEKNPFTKYNCIFYLFIFFPWKSYTIYKISEGNTCTSKEDLESPQFIMLWNFEQESEFQRSRNSNQVSFSDPCLCIEIEPPVKGGIFYILRYRQISLIFQALHCIYALFESKFVSVHNCT